jgi:hypothetical protein
MDKCKDPRDIIYAILSLAAFHRVDRALGVKPDYDSSVQQVYQSFTAEHIKSSQSLVLLERAGKERRSTDRINISWVPDIAYHDYNTAHHGITRKRYTASSAWKATFDFREPGYLVTRGLL